MWAGRRRCWSLVLDTPALRRAPGTWRVALRLVGLAASALVSAERRARAAARAFSGGPAPSSAEASVALQRRTRRGVQLAADRLAHGRPVGCPPADRSADRANRSPLMRFLSPSALIQPCRAVRGRHTIFGRSRFGVWLRPCGFSLAADVGLPSLSPLHGLGPAQLATARQRVIHPALPRCAMYRARLFEHRMAWPGVLFLLHVPGNAPGVCRPSQL